MFSLEENGLCASLLDPATDTGRLGSRYCSGGYVWQVTDARHGPLLSGPCFPAPEPPPFDGQGLPEVFEIALGQDSACVGDDVWVIGVGRVRRESAVRPFHVRDNPTVVERAAWSIERSRNAVTMRSSERFSGYALELVREISLRDRTLVSTTRLANTGMRTLPVRWFAHPFLPWADGECFRLSLETELPENPGFVLNDAGSVMRRAGHAWSRGCYVVPRTALGGELEVTARHPVAGDVRARCHFPLAWLALWGNDRTVSFEPFHATVLAQGAESRWAIEYTF
ncbi:MAG TPA: hypothetical protein VFZ53_32130 [Polyangiaceae bacterium]